MTDKEQYIYWMAVFLGLKINQLVTKLAKVKVK